MSFVATLSLTIWNLVSFKEHLLTCRIRSFGIRLNSTIKPSGRRMDLSLLFSVQVIPPAMGSMEIMSSVGRINPYKSLWTRTRTALVLHAEDSRPRQMPQPPHARYQGIMPRTMKAVSYSWTRRAIILTFKIRAHQAPRHDHVRTSRRICWGGNIAWYGLRLRSRLEFDACCKLLLRGMSS